MLHIQIHSLYKNKDMTHCCIESQTESQVKSTLLNVTNPNLPKRTVEYLYIIQHPISLGPGFGLGNTRPPKKEETL